MDSLIVLPALSPMEKSFGNENPDTVPTHQKRLKPWFCKVVEERQKLNMRLDISERILASKDRPLTRPFKRILAALRWEKFLDKNRDAFNFSGKRIFYFLTPPDRLNNLGDHAQLLAVDAWLEHHFSDHPVVVVDKDETNLFVRRLTSLVRDSDAIILHSGGNMGDNGLWTERARRLVVGSFPRNSIISLPQTISFSDTQIGDSERAVSSAIYGAHAKLFIYARDPESLRLGERYFGSAVVGCAPDFVLRFEHLAEQKAIQSAGKVLACLRQDEESILADSDRNTILSGISGRTVVGYDTTLPKGHSVNSWVEEVNAALSHFAQFDSVVTDRFHGAIFAIVTGRPVVILQTVNHKLTSAMHWFRGLSRVAFASSLEEIPEVLARVEGAANNELPDWDGLYFDAIAERIRTALNES